MASPELRSAFGIVNASALTPFRRRWSAASSPEGPVVAPPSAVSTVTFSARCNKGSAKELVCACSVLRFQATRTLRPMIFGTAFGTISTGRPASNKADSSGGMRGFSGAGPGRPSTIRSNTRP